MNWYGSVQKLVNIIATTKSREASHTTTIGPWRSVRGPLKSVAKNWASVWIEPIYATADGGKPLR